MSLGGIIRRKWPEWLVLAAFGWLVIISLVTPFAVTTLSDPAFSPLFGASLSIGTSGIVAFIFYYVVNERLERQKRELVKQGTLRAYRDAKRNIALAIIHASQKGGRKDLTADIETIEEVLTIGGFKKLFEWGREAHEGFYAFQNQMDGHTPEYDEIVFNLKIMGRSLERLVDTVNFNDTQSYNFFVQLDALIRRIERNGAGYDESKPLCQFVWKIFAGSSLIEGDLGHDPVEHAIEAA